MPNRGLAAAREVHDRNRLFWKQTTKSCPHSREVNSFSHATLEEAEGSFWFAVGLGLISADGLLLCDCEDDRGEG